MLTEVLCEHLFNMGSEARSKLWPIVRDLYQHWALGPKIDGSNDVGVNSDNSDTDDHLSFPYEALVRIGCKEMSRATTGLNKKLSHMENIEASSWCNQISADLCEFITENVTLQNKICEELITSKLQALGLVSENQTAKSEGIEDENMSADIPLEINTIFGSGQMISSKSDNEEANNIRMIKISLAWGATLYSHEGNEAILSSEHSFDEAPASSSDVSSHDLSCGNYLGYIPALKVRSIAAHILQKCIPQHSSAFAQFIGESDAKKLLLSLEKSREAAHKMCLDEDLAHAFQEAWRSEWGDGVREVELALAAMGGSSRHQGGSEVFFLSQEAGSNMAIIHLLSLLFCREKEPEFTEPSINRWDIESYSEPLLLDRIMDVLNKFIESEAKDSHLVDPSTWRTHDVSSGKIALYCTSFLNVVLGILEVIDQFTPEQFERNKVQLFPLICSLVKGQSSKIRELVYDLLLKQVGPLIGAITV